jgi:hypothetical protein
MSHRHWNQAPPWALRIRELQVASLQQGHVIIQMLKALTPTGLPPEDQAKVDQIYDEAVAIKTKIDAAEVD